MRYRFDKASLLAGTIMASALIASPAYAQQDDEAEPAVTTTADAEPAAEGETIVVTGSRIQRSDLTSTSPLAVVQDEEFKLSGAVNVEQVINTLPQVVPGTTSFSNNPGGGVATLNLRGLGSARNLVLVNGRRYIFFDANQVVDLNTIPQFLLDSVDVVTGGASAVYGSDALAGVINFKLRDDLNGLIAGGQYGITDEGDGARYNAYVAIGSDLADGRGNVTAYAEYYKREDIFARDRSFSQFSLGDGDNGLVPLGSAGVPQGRMVAPGTLAIGQGASCGGAEQPPRNDGCYAIAEGTNYPGAGAFFGSPGASTPYNSATDSYNYAPTNYLMVPQERYTIGGYGSYEVADDITAYAEVAFINNRVENELAATPLTQNVNFELDAIQGLVSPEDFAQLQLIAQRQQAAIAAAADPNCQLNDANQPEPCANPFGEQVTGSTTIGALQPGQVRLGVNTRTTSIASRNVTDERNAFRVLAGFRGNLTDTLQYDAYYSYSRTRNGSIQEGNVSRSAFTRLAADGTCNVFGEALLSPECVNAISILAQNTEVSTLQVAQGSISGPLFTSGWATDPVAFAAGVEYRKMSAEFIPDTALASGDVVGFNAGQPTAGSYSAKEVFGELRVPIIQNGFVDRLELSGGARYSDYSLEAVGGVWAYFAGAEFAPIPDITFRGQYQRAVRAPNVQELFGGQSVGFPAATDPCALSDAATNATLRALCIATGVPASNVGQDFLQPNAQIQGAFGGNADLQEEVADTFTVGVVLRPSFIPGLNVTVDYYDIEIDQAIATYGGGVNNILNICYNIYQDANSEACGLISRDSQGVISGPPFVVTALNANLAQLTTSGIDFQVDYSLPLGASLTGNGDSRLGFYFLGNYSDENNFTPSVDLPDEVVECAGKFGLNCGNPTPKWKWSSRLSWIDGPLTTTVRWRHTGKVSDDDDTTDYIVEEIGAYDVFDLAFGFEVNENFTLTMGVNNLFDKMPPIIGDNQEQTNTYPGVYDVLGRDYFVSVGMTF